MSQLIIHQIPKLLITQHAIPGLVPLARQGIEWQSFKRATYHNIEATFFAQDMIQRTFNIITNTTHIERHGIRGVDGVQKLTHAVLCTSQYRERCDILPHKTIADRR